MGLLQNIEGLFGFGKKAQQVPQDAAAIKAAAETVKSWLVQGEAVLNSVAPFASANPTIAAFLGFLKMADEEGQTAITVIEGFIPAPQPVPTPKTS